jgi:coenzyme Q-binding protein COQ10
MPAASVKKIINCKKDKLIHMVLDIEKYPEFVPWCVGGKINEKIDKGNTVEIKADLYIGKGIFKEKYKSLVIYKKLLDIIQVTNLNGPLKYLENKWVFKEIKNSTEVNFSVDFELKNKILNMLMAKSFDIGLNKIANAFETRANQLFILKN